MVKAAAKQGLIDERRVALEMLTSIKKSRSRYNNNLLCIRSKCLAKRRQKIVHRSCRKMSN